MNKKLYVYKTENCLLCGREIPEGRQVCPNCEERLNFPSEPEEDFSNKPSFFGRIFKGRSGRHNSN